LLFDRSTEEILQNVTMTMPFVLGAMAQQGDVLMLSQVFQKPQSKFLPVVLDVLVSRIWQIASTKFLQVSTGVLIPGDLSGQVRTEQFFTRTQVWHPHVVPASREAAAATSGRENAKAVVSAIDFCQDGFCLNHSAFRKMSDARRATLRRM
jgi:hypothetical protein